MNFAETLQSLPAVAHLSGAHLIDAQGQRVATLKNQPGQAGSLAVYHALALRHGGLITPAAALEGLDLYAEHTADARAHPGRHPNIDRLIAWSTGDASFRFEGETQADAAAAPATCCAAEPALPLAAIVLDGRLDVDALLADTAARLRRAGRRVHGLLMTYPGGRDDSCASAMVMVDLVTGDAYLVSQDLGPQSSVCRADPQGFARASQVLRRALEADPELVILNRFGSLESEGGGFRDELLALLAAGVPVLTAVSPKHLQAWQAFIGGSSELAADPDAVQRWLDSVLPRQP